MHAMVPVGSKTYSDANLEKFRGSTNLVQFHGGLLGLGHRRVPSRVHYWYWICPTIPHALISSSKGLKLGPGPVTFSLGLVSTAMTTGQRSGGQLYVSWSASDKYPYLSKFSHDEVLKELTSPTREYSKVKNATLSSDLLGACSTSPADPRPGQTD